MLLDDEYYMGLALREAEKAAEEGEIPVGAVMTCQGKMIAKGYNQTIRLNDATAHAEMITMTSATEYLGSRYLNDCTLYVTLEPCVMCAGALFWAQVGRVVYGASDEKRGFSRLGDGILHPKVDLVSGIMADECEELLQQFFERIRRKK